MLPEVPHLESCNVYLSVKAADIGIAQLAMHSSYETSGAYDTIYMSEFVKEFYGKETQI